MLRAKIVLLAAEGRLNQDIAAELKTSKKTVCLWRKRFAEGRLDSPQRIARRKPGQPSDREKLDAALKLNEPLATAYYLKEKLRC
ncbi:helix-turn-helix domain-containing protein, partial [bacterium]|nr:helix-turn-helix domain-containing protein [bacterium]